MSNPVRIYVLYHPNSNEAKVLTDRIYDWFRLSNLEGIPVYIRSQPKKGKHVPEDPVGNEDTLEYLVPLVDSHMVRDPAWHFYLEKLTQNCLNDRSEARTGWVMFPVALDGTSFNLPGQITQRNFIRFSMPAGTAPEQQTEIREHAYMGVLKDLTEAMSRDLNARLFPKQIGRKLKIFISYSRADGPAVPKAMRDYIQGRTQCEAFFDENDISFGSKYQTVLDQNAGDQARALIVVLGDHYADRPVCRWEIFKFTRPSLIPLDTDGHPARDIRVFHPVIVLNTLSSPMVTRVVPELGQAPTLRWEEGREMIAFSMLMRSVLFGARNVLAAQKIAKTFSQGIIVNRLPGPVSLTRLLDESAEEAQSEEGNSRIHYPGNGLPLLELQLLESTFKNTQLKAFRDVDSNLPDPLKVPLQLRQRPLDDHVIVLSYGHSTELNSLGYLPQHLEEASIYLLRPLLRLGADIMYGGTLPKRGEMDSSVRNMSLTLMNLLNDELSSTNARSVAPNDSKKESNDVHLTPSRLFLPIAWPKSEEISAEDEATWISTCSVIRLEPHEVNLNGKKPDQGTPEYDAWRARLLSYSRELMGSGFACPVPGNLKRQVIPAATIFIGGRFSEFSGCMPGIMEEFIYALRNKRSIYLLGGFGGAAGILADVVYGKSKSRSPFFSTAHYQKEHHYNAMFKQYNKLKIADDEKPVQNLDWLWKTLVAAREEGFAKLCRNGLTEAEYQELVQTTDTMDAVHLIWQGISRTVQTLKPEAKRTRGIRAKTSG